MTKIQVFYINLLLITLFLWGACYYPHESTLHNFSEAMIMFASFHAVFVGMICLMEAIEAME